MPLRVVVIVEGHGEDEAIRTLLERIWYDLLGGDYIEVIPWRAKQGQLRKKEGLSRVVEAAAIKLHATERTDFRRLLLVMIDTEGEECPKTTAAGRIEWAREVRSDPATEIACVMPNPMFETWFAASADSLRGKNDLPPDLPKPENPEGIKLGKSWVKKHLPRKYKETIDQPRFVGRMSLTECKDSSRSFCKLVKEIHQRLPTSPAPAPPAAKDQPPIPEQGLT
ncbi:MAG TPA: hypothetical protein DDY78_10755 [Planctomycetales bacterium]|jgi:hypothetical protein|nr:hypothetical protein [Planctomycetales bacterium]